MANPRFFSQVAPEQEFTHLVTEWEFFDAIGALRDTASVTFHIDATADIASIGSLPVEMRFTDTHAEFFNVEGVSARDVGLTLREVTLDLSKNVDENTVLLGFYERLNENLDRLFDFAGGLSDAYRENVLPHMFVFENNGRLPIPAMRGGIATDNPTTPDEYKQAMLGFVLEAALESSSYAQLISNLADIGLGIYLRADSLTLAAPLRFIPRLYQIGQPLPEEGYADAVSVERGVIETGAESLGLRGSGAWYGRTTMTVGIDSTDAGEARQEEISPVFAANLPRNYDFTPDRALNGIYLDTLNRKFVNAAVREVHIQARLLRRALGSELSVTAADNPMVRPGQMYAPADAARSLYVNSVRRSDAGTMEVAGYGS